MKNNLEKFVKKAWWATVAVGVLGILFGLFIFFWPSTVLKLAFSILALIVGAFAVVQALGNTKENRLWWLTLLFGVLCLSTGVFILFRPDVAVAVFTIIVSVVFFTQALRDLIVASYSNDKTMKTFFVVTGLVGFVVGFIVLFYPEAIVDTLGYVLGAYIVFRGASLLFYAYQTRSEFRDSLKKAKSKTIASTKKTKK